MATDIRVVLCTFPDADQAAAVARALVDARLAACVNLIPQVRSIYRWEGKVSDDAEVLAVIKTTAHRLAALRERVLALHPYECPEVIALPVDAGSARYLSWVADSCDPE